MSSKPQFFSHALALFDFVLCHSKQSSVVPYFCQPLIPVRYTVLFLGLLPGVETDFGTKPRFVEHDAYLVESFSEDSVPSTRRGEP